MKRIFIFVSIFLFVFSLVAFAGGQKEDPLAKARLLFQEKKYNETIIYLSELVKRNPEYRDAAEEIVEKIRKIREEYNKKYEELIDVLFEKHDVEGALKLIEELKKLDPNPNKATIASITRAKRGAEIVYNLNRFEKIMNKALAELKDSRYFDAVSTYLTGFDIQREEFENAPYGSIIKDSVNSALQEVFKAAKDFSSIGEETENLFNKLAFLVLGSDTMGFSQYSNTFIKDLRRIIEIKRVFIRASDVFRESNSIIRKRSAKNLDDYFLHYAYLLTVGRSNVSEEEGLINAVDMYFKDILSTFEERTSESAFLHFTRGKDLFRASEFDKAGKEFRIAYQFFSVLSNVKALWGSEIQLGKGYSIPSEYREIVEKALPEFLYVVEILHSIDTYLKLGDIASKLPDTENLGNMSVSQLKDAMKLLSSYRRDVGRIRAKWESMKGYYRDIGKIGFPVMRHLGNLSEVLSASNRLLSEIDARDIKVVNALNMIEYDSLASDLKRYDAEYEEGKKLKDGYDVVVEVLKDEKGKEIKVTRRERYPSKALNLLRLTSDKVKSLSHEINDLVTRLKHDPILGRNRKEQERWIAKTMGLFKSVVALEKRIEKAIADARELVLLAEKYKNEGSLRVNEAKLALKLEKFRRAKDAVEQAARAYENSLRYEENPDIRKMLDKVLPSLSAEIIKQENLYVVREVRRLINKGREYYGLGEFIKAEETFLRAKARWEDTNVTENKEITNWLNIVRAALSVKSGRVISKKDPLYTEMTQLLNLATEDYLEGAKLLKKGRKIEALAKFKSALDKIQRVKLAFPYNREARVLSLRIQQLSDPENFAASLTKFYNEAIKNMKTNPKESYADLKDIEEIAPNYPGLKRAIYRLEVMLKIIIPPPDPKKIAESNRLYEQAYKIVASNRVDLFPAALDQLNKAIELNPNNQKAIALKDRIQIAAGGTVQAVLSSAALEQFRIAENKYLAGEYFEALAIVERLLKDKRNRNYPPLLELKKRLKAKI